MRAFDQRYAELPIEAQEKVRALQELLTSPELREINAKLDQLVGFVQHPLQQWYTKRQACQLKGGAAFATMRTRPYLLPKGGRYDAYVGGVGVWSRETVMEWLTVTDTLIAEYNRIHKTGLVPPERKLTTEEEA